MYLDISSIVHYFMYGMCAVIYVLYVWCVYLGKCIVICLFYCIHISFLSLVNDVTVKGQLAIGVGNEQELKALYVIHQFQALHWNCV